MIDQILDQRKIFDTRYIKIHFTAQFLGDTRVPVYKTSGLRGGIGEMLLRADCLRDRDCEKCDFIDDCIVRGILYPKMENVPSFMRSGDSIGFSIECEAYQEYYRKGEEFQFNILLFGRTIIYFSSILHAVAALGMQGFGSDNSRFQISAIKGTKNKEILKGNQIMMENIDILTVREYILYRAAHGLKEKFGDKDTAIRLKFQSPLALKFRGVLQEDLVPRAIVEAALRRLYVLACFEGNTLEKPVIDGLDSLSGVSRKVEKVSVRRYSNRKKAAMFLHGIEGEVEMRNVGEEMLPYLIGGELLHIGGHTSFGFGRYHIF